MKKVLSCLFLLVLTIASAQININSGEILEKNYYTKIPYRIVNGLIIIEVEINAVKHDFLLDTGAITTLFSKFRSSDFKQDIAIPIKDSQNNIKELTTLTINQFKIAGLTFQNIPSLLEHEDNIISDCFNVDGIIGSNAFRNSVIEFNFDKSEIIVTNDVKNLDLKKGKPLKFTMESKQNSPIFFIAHSGKKTVQNTILFDTGYKGFYMITSKSYDAFKEYHVFQKEIIGKGINSYGLFGSEAESDKKRILIPDLQIGNTTIENIWTETSNDNISKLGVDLLHYGTAIIDYSKKKFYFISNASKLPYKNTIWPISPNFKDGKLVVGALCDTYLNKANLGDEIISIDTIETKVSSICDLITDPILKKKSILKLKKNTGEIYTVEMDKL
ncbi:hypothetical protein [Flavobacterium sp. '19STA2R22 D10 B1']|uniref:hypothetical protein n=1 Tax=Flavobacterium aerium TaxID=3037261 RepID=UPI00278C4DD5|nr:hypothetical protein [Flavobacterium sp. '19STA2R22 D10 B1']